MIIAASLATSHVKQVKLRDNYPRHRHPHPLDPLRYLSPHFRGSNRLAHRYNRVDAYYTFNLWIFSRPRKYRLAKVESMNHMIDTMIIFTSFIFVKSLGHGGKSVGIFPLN
jgi:hypothetical protein